MNPADQQPLKEIKDSVQGIVLGPNRTSNNGQILDANDIDPESAGTAFHRAQLERFQAESASQIAAVRQESAQQIAGLTGQITALTQAIQSNNSQPPQEDPLPVLTDEESMQIEPIRGAVDKLSQTRAEEAKRAALAATQQLINESNSAYEARIKQLEDQLSQTRQTSKSRFDSDLTSLGVRMGINVATLQNNANWNAFIGQPVSPFQPNVTIKDVLAQTQQTQDLAVWENVFQQFAAQYGGTQANTGLPSNQQFGQQHSPQQQQQTPMTGNAGMSGGNGFQNQQTFAGDNMQAQLQEIDTAHSAINKARADLHRQLHEERSINRETYTAQMAELVQMETDLLGKRRELTTNPGQ
jgi:hypothetical protein